MVHLISNKSLSLITTAVALAVVVAISDAYPTTSYAPKTGRPFLPSVPQPSPSPSKPGLLSGSVNAGQVHGEGTTSPLSGSLNAGLDVSASGTAGPPTSGSLNAGQAHASGSLGPPMNGCVGVKPNVKGCASMGPPMHGNLEAGPVNVDGSIHPPVNGNLPPVKVPSLN